jgi:hypothetical protein
MKISFHQLAAACAFAAAMQAHADTASFSGFAHGSETVNFSVTAPNVATSGATAAGGFLMSMNGGPSFDAYCVDLYQHIGFGDPPYTDYTVPGTSHVFANSHAYSDLGRLYATAGVISNAVSEAAFQIAVWEIAYETTAGPYDLSHGTATFSGGTADSSGALSLATSWLTHLTSGSYPSILVTESREHQDMIFAPVPEPETYALFMAGLAAMGFVARRRRG